MTKTIALKITATIALKVALLGLVPSLASAGELWGVVNLTSVHGKTKNPLNQNNFGLGVEYHQSDEVLYLGGAFHNSHRRTSVYAMAGWTPIEWKAARFGVVGGIVNGYPKHNDGKVIPIVAGLIRIEGERLGANIFIVPPALKDTPVTIGFQVKYRF